MRHFRIDGIVGSTINEEIDEWRIKLLASSFSPVGSPHFSVDISIVGPGIIHEEHQNKQSEELVVVIGGEGLAKIAGQMFPVIHGSVIEISCGESHQFFNTGQHPLKLLWIYEPPDSERRFAEKPLKVSTRTR